MLKFTQFCKNVEKSVFLKIGAWAFEAEYFLKF